MTPAMAAGVAITPGAGGAGPLLPDQPAAPWGSLKKSKESDDEPNSN